MHKVNTFKLILLVEGATLILLAPFLRPIPTDAWSFDEVMGAPSRLINEMAGHRQAQAPLPVPRTEMPPVGNNSDISPCAPPPQVASQDSHRQVAINEPAPASQAPPAPVDMRAKVLRGIREGQTLDGLIKRIGYPDDTRIGMDGESFTWTYNTTAGTYRLKGNGFKATIESIEKL